MGIRKPDTRQIHPWLLLFSVIVLTIVLAGAVVARFASNLHPRVGDIVSFDPAAPVIFASDARFAVARPGLAGCELEVALIRKMGGSFVVEGREPPPAHLFLVHWAGRHTSAGIKDCGADADLLLPISDLVALACAAGGFGVTRGWSRRGR